MHQFSHRRLDQHFWKFLNLPPETTWYLLPISWKETSRLFVSGGFSIRVNSIIYLASRFDCLMIPRTASFFHWSRSSKKFLLWLQASLLPAWLIWGAVLASKNMILLIPSESSYTGWVKLCWKLVTNLHLRNPVSRWIVPWFPPSTSQSAVLSSWKSAKEKIVEYLFAVGVLILRKKRIGKKWYRLKRYSFP